MRSAKLPRAEKLVPLEKLSRIILKLFSQEDVNGEKLTVKKWWIFGADFFTVLRRVFHGL